MFALQALLTTVLAFLALSVRASPVFRRDVVAPTITSPTADSVWPVGTVQTVRWDTSNFPAQITNPIGQIILGFNSSDSLNLDFDHPLAQGFKLTDGSVKITVPNVPPRDDYLIVLFGDSGDTSPTFAITRISASPGSSSSSSTSSSTPVTTPTPTAGSGNNGGSTTTTPDDTSASTNADAAQATPTSPSSSSSSSSSASSSSSSSSSSAASSSTTPSTSVAWSVHQTDSLMTSFNALAIFMASVVMLVMI